MTLASLVFVCATNGKGDAQGSPGAEVTIPAGTYAPFYPMTPGETLRVASFKLDAAPVTNAEFLTFVRSQPLWQRANAPAALVDPSYLQSWGSSLELGQAPPNAPVGFVSWFAAAAYCDHLGKRLPREAEWELVGRAGPSRADQSDDPEFTQSILRYYSRPRRPLPADVRGATPNLWGVHDMHGLHWEWVLDFNAAIVTGDNRQNGDNLRQLFCGGAAVGAADVNDYAAFMRFAFRGSLEATYTLHNLGFRCASDGSPH